MSNFANKLRYHLALHNIHMYIQRYAVYVYTWLAYNYYIGVRRDDFIKDSHCRIY